MAGFAREDEGQALIIAGFAMVILMGALVLGVDWGYRLATSRAVQNQADSAALAAGRALVTTWDGSGFQASQESLWDAACDARNSNALGAPTDATVMLRVIFFDLAETQLDAFSSASSTCTLSGGTQVPADTAFLRVEASSQFHSLFGMVTREDLQALAAARVRLTAGASVRPLRIPASSDVGAPGVGLSGASTEPNAAMWPLAIRYDSTTFAPGATRLITLITDNGLASSATYVTLSHHSVREASGGVERHQLVTESDYTAIDVASAHHGHTTTTHLANAAGWSSCNPSAVPNWESIGLATRGMSLSNGLRQAARCDVPNWFYYGYRGSLSVGTDWTTRGWDTFMSWNQGERPDPFTSAPRASCSYPYAPVPSCSSSTPVAPCGLGTACQSWTGDWAETVPDSYVRAKSVVRAMQDFIARYGRDLPDGTGKAVVVNVFLWDCGERFIADGTNDQWHLNNGSGDCSRATGTADRVHLIAVVPLTIRLADVTVGGGGGDDDCDGDCGGDDGSRVVATWGNTFGDAGICRSMDVSDPRWTLQCALNPVMNSAFLVPDEN